jgi:hypothetical protein
MAIATEAQLRSCDRLRSRAAAWFAVLDRYADGVTYLGRHLSRYIDRSRRSKLTLASVFLGAGLGTPLWLGA